MKDTGEVCVYNDSFHHSKTLPSALVVCMELGYSNGIKGKQLFTPLICIVVIKHSRVYWENLSLPSICIVLFIQCDGDEIYICT